MAGTAFLRSTALITVAALAVFAAYAILPRAGTLTHMDFLADNATVLELCNPLRVGPLPVEAGRQPATMSPVAVSPVGGDGSLSATFDLTTISGKPVAPEDLMSLGGEKIRLAIKTGQASEFSPPSPAGQFPRPDPFHPGRWTFSFVPSGPGPWRASAEFIPVATGKPLQASAVFEPAE